MSRAMYAGSFDPFTKGHSEIVLNSLKIFSKVIIAVANNPEKKTMFNVEERISQIREIFKNEDRVEVIKIDKGETTVKVAKTNSCTALIRGLRNSVDYEYEKNLAKLNLGICDDIVTIVIFTDIKYEHISSSAVKMLFDLKQDISSYVTNSVFNAMKDKYYINSNKIWEQDI